MIKKIKIWLLKKMFKKAYIDYRKHVSLYSCGSSLCSEISIEYHNKKERCKDLYKELKKIDPECPEEEF